MNHAGYFSLSNENIQLFVSPELNLQRLCQFICRVFYQSCNTGIIDASEANIYEDFGWLYLYTRVYHSRIVTC